MKFIIMGALILSSLSATAGTELKCKSANYGITITITNSGQPVIANYSINNKVNTGAEVEVENLYRSSNIVAAALNVDGQSKKFELAVTKSGPNKMNGKIFAGRFVQNANCSLNYAVTADERDDDSDGNL